jgi:hypothetical protein
MCRVSIVHFTLGGMLTFNAHTLATSESFACKGKVASQHVLAMPSWMTKVECMHAWVRVAVTDLLAGNAVGTVTSFAFTDGDFNYTVLAAVDASFTPAAGSAVTVARVKPEKVVAPRLIPCYNS